MWRRAKDRFMGGMGNIINGISRFIQRIKNIAQKKQEIIDENGNRE